MVPPGRATSHVIKFYFKDRTILPENPHTRKLLAKITKLSSLKAPHVHDRCPKGPDRCPALFNPTLTSSRSGPYDGSQFTDIVHDLIGNDRHPLLFSHPLGNLSHSASQFLVIQRPVHRLDQLLVGVVHRIQLVAIFGLFQTNSIVDLIIGRFERFRSLMNDVQNYALAHLVLAERHEDRGHGEVEALGQTVIAAFEEKSRLVHRSWLIVSHGFM